ncbi:vitamin K epoxide reductase family protein [Anaeromyxobacter oryzae]|uniref:Vitamin K epoxide reductase domain-containing protein n=1 Tax=Anaeromyxobacter oryzae TaxID=2918170 RepID=A0ABN6MWU5_9BACT|nr:vitamin K epoxide reductase family protein [Anaeromyxobacter oryzae]BDG04140.1 hypothetical protein AMOR_31360 [Anaeromyxobacter oryzae]
MTQKVESAVPRSRALETAILVLAALGFAIAVYLVLAHAGIGGHLCQALESERVSCDKVAASEWSILAGVPLAAWGALAYAAAFGLAYAARQSDAAAGLGLLVVLAGAMSAFAVFLAYVSEVVIGALCPFCALSWMVSFAILGCSLALARRAGGVGAAIRSDLQAARRRPVAWLPFPLALAIVAAGLLVAYRSRTVAAVTGPLTVLEFSDYECPYCARVHATDKQLVQQNPQLRLERRHFPLDEACNPKIKRPFHVGSCELARAALCADAQGKFAAMDDALFGNQQAKLPVESLASQVGLDLPRFKACLDSPDTATRLREDIDQGIALGVRATPSYAVNGKLYEGDLAKLLADAAKAKGP